SKIIGEGQPLLILLGLFGMSDNWKTFGKGCGDEHGYQVHLIDQRNHGRSGHTDEFSYALMAEDIKEYCVTHQLDNVGLWGHSMGGKTSMHFAVNYPELLQALVVVDIAPKTYPPHHQTILEGLTALNSVKLTSRREADETLAQYIDELSVRQFLLKNLYWEKGTDGEKTLVLRMNFPVIKANINAVGQAISDDETFEGNTLFIKGAESGYIEDDDRLLLKRHFPKSQLVTIKNAGHWVHAEQAEEFYQVVTAFLKAKA